MDAKEKELFNAFIKETSISKGKNLLDQLRKYMTGKSDYKQGIYFSAGQKLIELGLQSAQEFLQERIS